MKLKLELEERGLTWTLGASRKPSYTVGNRHDCDIFLPYVNVVSGVHLELTYKNDSDQECWCIRDLGSVSGTFIDHQRLGEKPIPITKETRISVAGGILLVATPGETQKKPRKQKSLITSTRLLSGYAYMGGITTGLELLNQLRADPYKATIPADPSLDLDEIITHSAQAVAISLASALTAIGLIAIASWLMWLFELEPNFLKSFAIVGILILVIELNYLRWFNACRFLNNNYRKNQKFRLNFLDSIVNFLKHSIIKSEEHQNIITFSGSNPFLGAGEQISGSSWTIPIARREKQENDKHRQGTLKYIDISVYEFYQAVVQEIEKQNLPNLQNISRLFVDGFELEPDGKILTHPTSRPAVKTLDDPLFLQESHQPASKQRAYQVYRYVDQQRDYILSHFLRFYNAGTITFVESSAYILTGIDRQRFSLISLLEDPKLKLLKTIAIVGILIALLSFTPTLLSVTVTVFFSLWYVAQYMFNVYLWRLNDEQQKRAAKFQEEYSYGLEQTFREYIAEPLNLENKKNRNNRDKYKPKIPINKLRRNPLGWLLLIIISPILLILYFLNSYRQVDLDLKVNLDYYGTQDVLMYWKAIQESIFKGTRRLLKRKGVDTTDFESSVSGIVNNGVMLNANNITNSQIAGGAGSNSSQTMTTPPAQI